MGFEGVIAVHKEHIVALCRLQAGISSTAQTPVFMMNDPDQLRIAGSIVIANAGANAVRAAVIHQNDLAVAAAVG